MTTKNEPTTAEAFATARTALVGHSTDCVERNGALITDPCDCGAGEGMPELALLERRMGAMARAIQNAPHGETCMVGRSALVKDCTCWKRGALTAAPPVFTLEEVEAAFHAVVDGDDPRNEDILRAVLRRLTALRSTGGGR